MMSDKTKGNTNMVASSSKFMSVKTPLLLLPALPLMSPVLPLLPLPWLGLAGEKNGF
jgi:hypothetical protein